MMIFKFDLVILIILFVEKIKRYKGRIDVSKLDEDDLSGDSLTGGYVVKIDKSTGTNNGSWVSNFQTISSNPKLNAIYV